MRRGELYLVRKLGPSDPKKQRVYAIVSRQLLIDSKFSTVICAPVYSHHDGLSTQVRINTNEGLKHESSIHCDALASLPRTWLTRYVGQLDSSKIEELDAALNVALGLDEVF
jgi:mRNA interferase MazF